MSSRVVASLVSEFYGQTIPQSVKGDLADLGCGKAPLYGAYREYCDSVTLVDWENSAHPNPLLDIVADLNEPLVCIRTESLDTVILSDVLEHIREPSVLLSEIARILRPGGNIILNVPFAYRLHEAPYDYYRYTSHALEYLIQKAGLELIELKPLGGWLEIMADIWSKLWSACGLNFVSAVIHRVVMSIYGTSYGKRFATIGGKVFPLGYGVVARKPTKS